jgi:hypothetical protein
VANKDYIERLNQVIFHLHKANPTWIESVPVEEIFDGNLIWKGIVEVFTLANHPKAKRCFAWSHRAGADDSDERFVAVLEIPPVTSPESAVKVAIVAEVRDKK